MIHPRLRNLVSRTSKAVVVEAKVWARRLIEVAVCAGAVIVGIVLLSCIAEPYKTDPASQQPAPADRHEPVEHTAEDAPRRTVVLKPPAGDTRHSALLLAGESLERDVDGFVESLLDELSPHDAGAVRTMYRLHSTGHFLRQLDDWAASPAHRDALSADLRIELTTLVDRWTTLRGQIAQLARTAANSP